jgi:pimeloyl-ACP methyl ester carboxylesterase
MTATVHTLTLGGTEPGADLTVELTVDDQGSGRPFLLLHGGGGPQTVAAFAGLLAEQHGARVLTPVHPGFGGTERPEQLTDVGTLARLYADLLDTLDLRDVIVVGNSIGGWIAAELALLGSERVSGYVLVDAAGIEVPGHPVVDIFPLAPQELSALSFHNPARFGIDPAALPEAVRAAAAGNRASLAVYQGPYKMADPGLRERLAKVTSPVLVVWGESDRVVDRDYGRAYAAAIPGAHFVLIAASGHLPQIETPSELLRIVAEFAEENA